MKYKLASRKAVKILSVCPHTELFNKIVGANKNANPARKGIGP
jgi:hypothetical protein